MTNEDISETMRIKIDANLMVFIEFQGERLILTISEASELSTNLKNMIKFSTENDSGFSNTLILESCPKS
jgi:hypothetical protein